MRLDSSDEKATGYLNGAATEKSAAGTGGRSNGAADFIMFNQPAVDRTLDGVGDSNIFITGVALSDHIYKRFHDFIFIYLN